MNKIRVGKFIRDKMIGQRSRLAFMIPFCSLLLLLLLSGTVQGARYELPGPQGSVVLDSVEIRSAEYFDILSFAEQTGMDFQWQPALQRLEVTSARGDQIVLIVGLDTYKLNSQVARMTPPIRSDGKVLVKRDALKRIASTLGIELHWEQKDSRPTKPADKELTLDELLALLSDGTATPEAATEEVPSPTPTEVEMPFGPKGYSPDDFAKMIEEAQTELKREQGERLLRRGGVLTRVVLDPAHGGEESGSIGPAGTQEAEICWQVCQILKERFEQGSNIEVFLTRENREKEPVSNAMRAARANAAQGELLISIHCGAGFFPEQSGMSVFYPSEQEKDPLQPEIEVISGEIDESGERTVKKLSVWKQAGLPYQKQSLNLANGLNDALQVLSTPEQPLVPRSAYLELLQSVQMPSVLLEIGVISNSKEELLLRQRGYLREIAESIYTGIISYLREQE